MLSAAFVKWRRPTRRVAPASARARSRRTAERRQFRLRQHWNSDNRCDRPAGWELAEGVMEPDLPAAVGIARADLARILYDRAREVNVDVRLARE